MSSSSCHAYTSFLARSPHGHCCLKSECSPGGQSCPRLDCPLRKCHPDLFELCLSSLSTFSWDLVHQPFLSCCLNSHRFCSSLLSLWQSRFRHWPSPSMEIYSGGVCPRPAQYSHFWFIIIGTFLELYRSLSQTIFWPKSAKESLETSLSNQSTWWPFCDWTVLTSVSFGKPLPDNHLCPLSSIEAKVYSGKILFASSLPAFV